MRIVEQAEKRKDIYHFMDVRAGEPFEHDGETYIRLDDAVHGGIWNAIRMSDGKPGAFTSQTTVEPLPHAFFAKNK